eukprot:360457-Chlamydomonas_euryale.AAC.2
MTTLTVDGRLVLLALVRRLWGSDAFQNKPYSARQVEALMVVVPLLPHAQWIPEVERLAAQLGRVARVRTKLWVAKLKEPVGCWTGGKRPESCTARSHARTEVHAVRELALHERQQWQRAAHPPAMRTYHATDAIRCMRRDAL